MSGGLRQLQQHKTAPLGQMPSKTLTGGTQGRAKLLHGGMGANAGGANAKGTGGMAAKKKIVAPKIAVPPKPAPTPGFAGVPGWFQYGSGQWGSVSAKGMINWKAKQPPKGAKVYGWNEITPMLKQRGILDKVPKQNATPNPFVDDLYTRNMAGHKLDYDTATQGAEYNIKQADRDLEVNRKDASDKFIAGRNDITSNMGAAGLGGSGVAAATVGDASSQFDTFVNNLVNQHTADIAKLGKDEENATTAYNATKASEIGLAKDRWTLDHPGAVLPQIHNGVYTDGGQTYYQNPKTGVTTTFRPTKPVAAKKKVVPVSKFPGAKTFTDGHGVVRKLK